MKKPTVFENDNVFFVDVDDTLVKWNGLEYTPHKRHIKMIKKAHTRGQMVFVWSYGGWEWANRIVKELGLEPYVTAVFSKPRWVVDDLPASEILLQQGHVYLEDKESDLTRIEQAIACLEHLLNDYKNHPENDDRSEE